MAKIQLYVAILLTSGITEFEVKKLVQKTQNEIITSGRFATLDFNTKYKEIKSTELQLQCHI